MIHEELIEAQRNGDFVTLAEDGVELLGTIVDVLGGSATLDVIGYRNSPEDSFIMKVMGPQDVLGEKVMLYQKYHQAASEEITDDPNEVDKLFSVGSEVVTEEGSGVVVDVQFNIADYEGDVQLEPPAIVVELEDGTTIHTCLCSIELPEDEQGTEILHSEFDRLWPPMDDYIPEDAEMLLPEEHEEEEATMRTAEYQGWKNYETWAVALWIDNERSDYEYWREVAEELKRQVEEEGSSSEHWSPEESVKYDLANTLKESFEEAHPLADQPSVWSDLLSGALSEVNWDEIAESFLEE